MDEYKGKTKVLIDKDTGDIYEDVLGKFFYKVIENDQRIAVKEIPESCVPKTEDIPTIKEVKKTPIVETKKDTKDGNSKETAQDATKEDEKFAANEIVKNKVHTKEELYAMNKKEQIELIAKLSGKDITIPVFEKGRVELLMELEKKGDNNERIA